VKHVTDWRGKSAYHNGKKVQVGLESVLGGAPNPPYLEWVMGWPLDWTDIRPLGMDRFHEWQQQHGIFFTPTTMSAANDNHPEPANDNTPSS
jgi:hypothetical protein